MTLCESSTAHQPHATYPRQRHNCVLSKSRDAACRGAHFSATSLLARGTRPCGKTLSDTLSGGWARYLRQGRYKHSKTRTPLSWGLASPQTHLTDGEPATLTSFFRGEEMEPFHLVAEKSVGNRQRRTAPSATVNRQQDELPAEIELWLLDSLRCESILSPELSTLCQQSSTSTYSAIS